MIREGWEWLELDSYFQLREITPPTTTPDNTLRLYAKDSGGVSTLCFLNDAELEVCFPTTGGTLVTGTGAAGQVAFWTSPSNLDGEDELFWDITNNRLGILTAGVPLQPLDVRGNVRFGATPSFFWNDTDSRLILGGGDVSHLTSPRLLIEGAPAVAEFASHTADPINQLITESSRGTHAAPTILSNNDRLLSFHARGYDGGAYRDAARITFEVDGTPGGSDMPGRIDFWTTPDGSTVMAKRFRIGQAGQWGIGDVDYGAAGQVFTSGGAAAPPTWTTPAAGTVTGSGSNGQVAFWTAATVLSGENNLFWDAANNRLGIGTTTPGFALTIVVADGADVISWRNSSFELARFGASAAANTGAVAIFRAGTQLVNIDAAGGSFLRSTDANLALLISECKFNPAGNIWNIERQGVLKWTWELQTNNDLRMYSGDLGDYVLNLDESGGNVGIGATSFPSGTFGLIFADGTALSSMASNTAGFYANDVGGIVNMFTINEAGEATQIGPAGTYTPTLTNVANISASTAYQCQYMRLGNTVTVSGKVDVDPTTTLTPTQLGISLPIASNIGAVEDVGGVAFAPAIAAQGAAIVGDAANDRAEMQWIASDVTNQPMFFTFTYQVI